jgi:N-formylmaleamate deformylase
MKIKTPRLICLIFAFAMTSGLSAQPFTVSVSGTGKAMILIPGLASPGSLWDETVRHFDSEYEMHVLHLAGFASAPPPASGSVLISVREALADYIREQQLQNPIVIGHSLGGLVALDLASKHAGMVGPLVIVDSLPFILGVFDAKATVEQAKEANARIQQFLAQIDDTTFTAMIRSGMVTRNMVQSESDHEQIVQWILASDRRTVADTMAEILNTDLRQDLPRITSPALVLGVAHGFGNGIKHDGFDSIYHAQFANLPDLRIAISETARHFIMLDEPEWLFAQMESFLQAVSQP